MNQFISSNSKNDDAERSPKFKIGDKVKHYSVCEVFTVIDSKFNGYVFRYNVIDVEGRTIEIPENELVCYNEAETTRVDGNL